MKSENKKWMKKKSRFLWLSRFLGQYIKRNFDVGATLANIAGPKAWKYYNSTFMYVTSYTNSISLRSALYGK